MELNAFLTDKGYSCIGAKASVALGQMRGMVVPHMACPAHDCMVLEFLYSLVDDYRKVAATTTLTWYSAAVVFQQPAIKSEAEFDKLLWQRLQALADLDAQRYAYDSRVEADPGSPLFSFSLKEEAFFIIGLHPASSRLARRFRYATLVFNLHTQFEKLRMHNRYEPLKRAIRKREKKFSGSLNPMLNDFGEQSEVYQYSGMQHGKEWSCPLTINHGKYKHHSTP